MAKHLITVEATGVVRDKDGNVKDTFPIRHQEVRDLSDDEVRQLQLGGNTNKENKS